MSTTKMAPRFGAALISAVCVLVTILWACGPQPGAEPRTGEAGPVEYPSVDASFMTALEWRSIGPFRGGRVPAVAGDPDDPLVFYFGSGHGGVWKTTDAGRYWRNVSDGFFKVAPVGAMDISLSNPQVLYVGTGEGIPRQHITSGDGVYKTTDGGETWTNVGLQETLHISKLRVHPRNPDIVYVAAKGDMFGPSPHRGVYRTRDGGQTWEKILYVNEWSGAVDLSMDNSNPNVIFASLNHHVRYPWDEVSGGPGTGLFKTADGGDTWTDLTRNPGMPEGDVGKIGVSISPPRPNRIYAMVEAADGGVYRSDDGGDSWQHVSADRSRRLFPASYNHITADTQDPDVVYLQHMAFWRSTDGGRTFRVQRMEHSDHHALWIDPNDSDRMIDGGDGGAAVTLNGGASWSTLENQPTADLFSLAVDDQDPYWVYASQNDNSHIAIPSQSSGRTIGWTDYIEIPAGEGGQTAVKPDGSVVYACDRTTMVRFDRRSGQAPNISVWPEDEFGAPVKDVKYRFYYSFPVLLSPHDPGVLYTAAQFLFRSTDEGDSWVQISPDLTRNRQDVMEKIPGGPITSLASSLYYVSLIRTIAESPLEEGELWVGTDDSTVQVSRNGGRAWEDVSPPDLPEWTTITAIDVSPHHRGTAYLAGERHRVSDRTPYLYRTTDYGRSWERITTGIRENDFTWVIREDPVRPGLLYAGTETGVYVSFDAGASWQSLQGNLPPVTAMFMLVKDDDLVIGTHGRGFWILDNIGALRELTPEVVSAPVHLFAVAPTARSGGGRRGSPREVLDAGINPPSGVMIEYYLAEAPTGEATLTIVDAAGEEIQRFSTQQENGGEMPADAGMNRFLWDMRYPSAREAPSSGPLTGFEASQPVPPVAPPGRYAVHLTVGEQIYEQPFEIRRDPRVLASDADLQAQFELMLQIRDRASEVADALHALGDARSQLEEHAAALTGDAQARANEVKEELRTIEGQLTRLIGSHDMELGPKGLINKLGRLSGAVVGADARPTQSMYAVFEDLSVRIAEQLRLLDEVIQQDLPALLGVSAEGAGSR
jgi:photosystem II stability/assembly factor-like uncharacterized protein